MGYICITRWCWILFGMILGLASFILDPIESTADTNEDLKILYQFFPCIVNG